MLTEYIALRLRQILIKRPDFLNVLTTPKKRPHILMKAFGEDAFQGSKVYSLAFEIFRRSGGIMHLKTLLHVFCFFIVCFF